MKKIPYGLANFKKLRRNGYLYIDKTAFIPTLEMLNDTLFFIRPRKFGKSLLLSMLDSYYDVNAKDDFEFLFGDLAIGKHPTELKNDYLVMRFNFSGIITDQSGKEFKKSFDRKVLRSCELFIKRYREFFDDSDAAIVEINKIEVA